MKLLVPVVLLLSLPAFALGYPFTKDTRLINSHDYGPKLVVADINGDGAPDLFALSEHKFTWFENKAKGKARTFVEHDIDATFKEPYDAVLVDMDGDKDLDLVAVARYQGIAWWENIKGGKKWKRHTVTKETKGKTRAIGAGDVDGDGDMDLVIAGRGVAWLENEGGKFGEAQQIYDAKRSASDVLVADFDGDKDADVVAVADLGYGHSSLVYWKNNGGPWEQEQLSDNLPVEDIRAQDLDGDKDLDVVATLAHEVQIFLADKDGLTLETSLGANEKIFFGAAAVGDFDQDGDLDVINGTANGNQGLLLLHNPKEGAEWETVMLDEKPVQPRSIVAIDVDGDKDLDLIVTYWSAGLRSHRIQLHENKFKKPKTKKK